jgi:hypothetical protein
MWLQEGPQAWCRSSSRGARVELLLQVGGLHLWFLVKFHNLICYWCDMWIIECWILYERIKVCVMMLLFRVVYRMYMGSRWMIFRMNRQVMEVLLTYKIWEVWYMAWTSIHLVYVRISGKGFTMHRLAYI